MKHAPKAVLALLVVSLAGIPAAYAHGGGLDAYECHHEKKTGGYHCHRPASAKGAGKTKPKPTTAAMALPSWTKPAGVACKSNIRSYDEMSKCTAGHDGSIEAHHLVERRHLEGWGYSAEAAPSVILTREEHDRVTTALAAALPPGKRYSKAEVRAKYKVVYWTCPAYLKAVEKYLR